MTYYKAFREDGRTLHNRESWPLPQGDEPGAWVEAEGDLVPCWNGLHVMREQDLAYWAGPTLFEVEIDGESIEAGDKVVCRRARLTRKVETWDRRTLVAWVCDCTERVLPIFEKKYPEDKRPRNAIEVTRAWVAGKATLEEVKTAADAAHAAACFACAFAYAARAAAYAAAATYASYAAAYAADAAYAVNSATYAAADAATYASYAAANAIAERTWQSKRMLEYIRGEVKP